MTDRDQPQINYLFATAALAVGSCLGVALSHAFWRMDYLLHSGSGMDAGIAKTLQLDRAHVGRTKPSLDYLAFQEKIRAYDALGSVLESSKRMERLFDDVPNDAMPLAVGLIDEIQTHMAQRRAAEVLFTRWAGMEPAAALAAADTLEKRLSRKTAQRSVLTVWAQTDFDGMRDHIAQLPEDRQRESLLDAAIRPLSERSPGKAVALLLTSADSFMKSKRLPNLGGLWGRIDAAAALKWAGEHLGAPEEQSAFKREVIHGWALERPADALEHVRKLSQEGDEQSRGLLVEVLRGWASEDPAAAVRYIFRFDEESEQLNLMHAISETLSEADAESILNWTNAFESEERIVVLAQLIKDKLGEDPVSGAMLASHLPNGDLQEAVFADLALTWAQHDAPGASQWLTSLPPSPARDSAAATFANAIIDREPGIALDWADTIGDAQKRSETLTALVERWLLSDPAAAERWLAGRSGVFHR